MVVLLWVAVVDDFGVYTKPQKSCSCGQQEVEEKQLQTDLTTTKSCANVRHSTHLTIVIMSFVFKDCTLVSLSINKIFLVIIA